MRRHQVRGGLWAFVYLTLRHVLGFALVLLRSETTNQVELLALRQEMAVFRREVRRSAYQPADRAFLAALSRPVFVVLLLGDARDAARLASAARGPALDLSASSIRATAGHRGDHRPCTPSGQGELSVGQPPHPRRADQARRRAGGEHDRPDREGPRDQTAPGERDPRGEPFSERRHPISWPPTSSPSTRSHSNDSTCSSLSNLAGGGCGSQG